jgi:ketosteroid isomerase-like protein
MVPLDGSAPSEMRGPVLSIFRKRPDGTWVLFRDANMLTPVGGP